MFHYQDEAARVLPQTNDFTGATFHAALVVIGEKLGLYKALAEAGPSTPAELAARNRHRRALCPGVACGPGRGGYAIYGAQARAEHQERVVFTLTRG